jgi:hypothetical protein
MSLISPATYRRRYTQAGRVGKSRLLDEVRLRKSPTPFANRAPGMTPSIYPAKFLSKSGNGTPRSCSLRFHSF